MTISEYFAGKNIFLTGGSGFLGKVLIEKVLRTCTDVGTIYVLLREKKGKAVDERLENIKNMALFDVLKKQNPGALDKLVAIKGDTSELKLGMSDENRQLIIDNVNIIYHTAASVRFDDSLKYAILLNIRGTKETVELATEVKNLLAFVHVSTAYCNIHKRVIEEKIYPPLADWRLTIKLAEEYEEDSLDALTLKYIDPLPNTYTFTKSLAEHVVEDLCRGKVPAIILRPSIVVPTMVEPFVGWNDNTNGPVGLLAAGGKGVLRTVWGNRNSAQDYVPVDVIAKLLLMVTHAKSLESDPLNDISVYNGSRSVEGDYTIGEIIEMGAELIWDSPFRQILWYPRFKMTACWYDFYLKVLILHMLPALFIDIVLRILGRKPMLVTIQRKVYIANVVLEMFISNSWTFVNTKSRFLFENLEEDDKEAFGADYFLHKYSREVFYEYLRAGKIGTIVYVFKEKFERAKCLRNVRRLWMIDTIKNFVLFAILVWFLFVKMNIVSAIYNRIFNYIENC